MGPLETIGAGGVSFKAKYVKRTGSPGKYRYWYRNPKTGALQSGKQPSSKKPSAKKPKTESRVATFKREQNRLRDERDTAMKNAYKTHKEQTIAEDARHSKESYKIFDKREKAEDAADKKYDAGMDELHKEDEAEAKRALGLSKDYSYGFEKSDKKK